MTQMKRGQPMGQTIGGMVYGFEYQVFRKQPPPHELCSTRARMLRWRARMARS